MCIDSIGLCVCPVFIAWDNFSSVARMVGQLFCCAMWIVGIGSHRHSVGSEDWNWFVASEVRGIKTTEST